MNTKKITAKKQTLKKQLKSVESADLFVTYKKLVSHLHETIERQEKELDEQETWWMGACAFFLALGVVIGLVIVGIF